MHDAETQPKRDLSESQSLGSHSDVWLLRAHFLPWEGTDLLPCKVK